jgi:hypothetical protein
MSNHDRETMLRNLCLWIMGKPGYYTMSEDVERDAEAVLAAPVVQDADRQEAERQAKTIERRITDAAERQRVSQDAPIDSLREALKDAARHLALAGWRFTHLPYALDAIEAGERAEAAVAAAARNPEG